MSRGVSIRELRAAGIEFGPDSPLRVKPRAKSRDEEHHMQCAVVAWAQLAATRHPELEMLMALPNWLGVGTARHGARLKAEGRRAGVPDLLLPVRVTWYDDGACEDRIASGLWIELKTLTGRVRPEQTAWHVALRGQGYHVAVCRSLEETQSVLLDYIAGRLLGAEQ